MNGRGLVDVAVITHFGSEFGSNDPRGAIDWNQAEKNLCEATASPIYKIHEGDLEIFHE